MRASKTIPLTAEDRAIFERTEFSRFSRHQYHTDALMEWFYTASATPISSACERIDSVPSPDTLMLPKLVY